MSVSSERTCSSPASSHSSEGSTCGHMKLKRRWIEMTYTEELSNRNQIPDLSTPKHPRLSVIKSQPENQIQDSTNAQLPRVVLPADPRIWTKRDVMKWLKYMTLAHDIELSPDKFDMNGKALCMMTMEMFVKRVPIGGKFLYKDFRLRLYPAVFFQKYAKPDYSKMTPLEMLAVTTGKYFP